MNDETIKKVRMMLQNIIRLEDERLLRFLHNNSEAVSALHKCWKEFNQTDGKQPSNLSDDDVQNKLPAPIVEESGAQAEQYAIDAHISKKNIVSQDITSEATMQAEAFDTQCNQNLSETEDSEYQVEVINNKEILNSAASMDDTRPKLVRSEPLDTVPIDALEYTKPMEQSRQQQEPLSLPNANKGKPYEARLPASAENVHIEPANIGLSWDKNTQTICGIPEFSTNVKIKYRFWENSKIFTDIEQSIFVNPDPKDLWKNIPSNQNDRFAKPDQAKQNLTTSKGRLIAARVRGRSHAHKGLFCDDDFSLYYDEASHVHLLAVSDGAGSAEFSRLGSQLAVNAVRNTVKRLLNDRQKNFCKLPELDIRQQEIVLKNLLEHAVYDACTKQIKMAEEQSINLKSLSCTLLVVLTMPAKDGRWLSAAYWVGDGAAGLWLLPNQKIVLLGEADSGSYSGETRFLSTQEVDGEQLQKRLRIHFTEQKPIVILMTDGVSDAKFETEARLEQDNEWQKLWYELQEPLAAADSEEALIDWLDFWSQGNHDDRTLALFIPYHTQENSNQESGKQ